jgi:hypothetical protein
MSYTIIPQKLGPYLSYVFLYELLCKKNLTNEETNVFQTNKLGHVFIDFLSSQLKNLKLEVGGMLASILTYGDDHMIR